MVNFNPGPKPNKPKPGHPDLDLCDLRNNLKHHIKGYVTPDYRDGVMYAVEMIEEIIRWNELDRERRAWAKKMGMK